MTRPRDPEDLRDLAHAHHLVMDEQDRILMAHPFASIPPGFAVIGPRTLCYLRSDPGQAREYFREAGLQGAFWGR